jgi:hypothetical protein
MPDSPPPNSAKSAELASRLDELAVALRSADHLDEASQRALADLVQELGHSFAGTQSSSPAAEHVAETAAHVLQALHNKQPASILTAGKEKLQAAAARLEAEAPLATGLVKRLLEALSDLGI